MTKIAIIASMLLAIANLVSAGAFPKSPYEITPLFEGQSVPEAVVKTVEGADMELMGHLKEKKAVLIFYRGGWCPYCNKHLEELYDIEDELLELGYEIIAMSPDQPSVLKKHTEGYGFNYQLLSDSDQAASKAFGVAFELDEKTLSMLEKYNIDVEAASGNKLHVLPVPAVFIVDNGKIDFSYVNPDYSTRLSGQLILEAARFSKKN
jgi:peroxiredoxin